MNTLDWIAKWASYTPDKIAVTAHDRNEHYTYGQLNRYANRLTIMFEELHLEEGDRIAVLAEQGLDYIVLFVACQRMGIILVPLNYRLSLKEINYLVADCTPSLLIYNTAYQDKIEALCHGHLRAVSFDALNRYYQHAGRELYVPTFDIKADNPLFIFYTSGTTGVPKGVLYTNKMMFWNSLNTSMQLGITFKDSTITVLPPYHTSGWHVFVTPLLHKGAHVGILPKFDAERTLRLLEENKSSLFMALPTMLMTMQKTVVFKEVNLESLRYIISGGEKVPFELVSYWKAEKNIYIRPGYGLTEAGPSITSLHHEMAQLKPNSIGKPNFYLDIKIVDTNGRPVKPYDIGELCIKGHIVTPGYWNNSVKTNTEIKKGWLHTGDFVYADPEGFLYIQGRKNDMYISGGENIYPQEIEGLLETMEGIAKAVVLSVPDDTWGQCGIAFVTTTDKAFSVAQIRNYLNTNLVAYKHPKYIFILDEIPITSLGKVSRKKLYAYFNAIKSES